MKVYFRGTIQYVPLIFIPHKRGAALVFDKTHSALYAFSSAMAKLRLSIASNVKREQSVGNRMIRQERFASNFTFRQGARPKAYFVYVEDEQRGMSAKGPQ